MNRPRELFAYKLAAQMGTVDVGGMLSQLPPDKFDEWWAASLTGRLDDSWAQASMVCAVMVNVLRELAAGFAGASLADDDYVSPEEFMPGVSTKQADTAKAKKADESIANFGKVLAERFKDA